VGLIVLEGLGHFVAAKAVGMRVERFSLFFPPKLVGIKRGETEYSIGAIPAGGYVKITGMSPVELGLLDLRVADRAYYMQQPWKRIVVILAGPAVNLLIAFFIFWGVLLAGSPSGSIVLGNLNPAVPTTVPSTRVLAVEPGGPAAGRVAVGDPTGPSGGKPRPVQSARARIDTHRCAGAQSK